MFRHPHNDVKGLVCSSPSKVANHLGKMCNVNNMVARLIKGDSSVTRSGGFFGDISDLPDGLSAILNKANASREAFDRLPYEVRSRFTSYDAFLGALSKPEEKAFFQKVGIFKPDIAPESPVKVEVVNPSTKE